MLKLTDAETATVIRGVGAEFRSFVDKYEESKYPPAELNRLRNVFGRREAVSYSDVEAALVWKYGYTGKLNYPNRQRNLARRITDLWSINGIGSGEDPAEAFQRWRQLIGPTSFITMCFLLHLAQPEAVPILDQHNFRSVNFHLMTATGRVAQREKPRHFEDLVLVHDFIELVRRDWPKWAIEPTPSLGDIDRYLMMHGKWLKAQRRHHMPA